ncbi:MAG: hypothetical protein M3O41_14345 [Pseudomonadota bacterium]|nr:hypothetical protein [Pseudomonadota bacterium]
MTIDKEVGDMEPRVLELKVQDIKWTQNPHAEGDAQSTLRSRIGVAWHLVKLGWYVIRRNRMTAGYVVYTAKKAPANVPSIILPNQKIDYVAPHDGPQHENCPNGHLIVMPDIEGAVRAMQERDHAAARSQHKAAQKSPVNTVKHLSVVPDQGA